MTTLEDLYGYYCRRCECKPNSTLQAQLKEAFESAEHDRAMLTQRLITGELKQIANNNPNRKKTTTAIGATTTASSTALLLADGTAEDANTKKEELAMMDPTYSRNNNPNLREIDLSTNYVGPKGLEPILLLVKNLYSIHTLRLCHNMLQHEAVVLLSQYLGGGGSAGRQLHPSLHTIDLRSNLLTNGSAAQLIFLVESNPNITTLLLSGNDGLTAGEMERIQTYVQKNIDRKAAEAKAAAEEDAIAAKARLDRPLYLAHKAKLEGLALTRANSGGHFHYATWRRNAQYMFRVSHTTLVSFTLVIEPPIVSTRQYGFAIIKAGANACFGSVLRVVDAVSKEQLAEEEKAAKKTSLLVGSSSSSSSSPSTALAFASAASLQRNVIIAESPFHERRAHLELTLDANVGDADSPYVLVVYSFAPDRECPSSYSLAAEVVDGGLADRERAFVKLEPLSDAYDWSQVSLEGQWGGGVNATSTSTNDTKSETSAAATMGPLPYASWRENESFRVRCVPQQGEDSEGSSSSPSAMLVSEVDAVTAALRDSDNRHSAANSSSKKRAVNKSPATAAVQQGEAISKAIQSAIGYKSKYTPPPPAAAADVDDTVAAAPRKPFIDAPFNKAATGPQTLRVCKSLLAGLATVYIVLTKSNDSDVNNEDSIGFYVVTPDRKGRLPMRIVNTLPADADNSSNNNTNGGGIPTRPSMSTTGLPIMPQQPSTATDGALIAYCPHQRKTTVAMTVEIPVGSMDFFIIPTTSRASSSSSSLSEQQPFALQVFSTAAIAVERYTHATSSSWCGEWQYKAHRLPLDATSNGGCKQDNGSSWTHNHAVEIYNDGSAAEGEEGEEGVGTSAAGLDLCVSVEPTAATIRDANGVREPVEVGVALVALRRCATAAEALADGGATVANVTALDTALASTTVGGKRSATSLQHQLLVIAHSPFTSASPAYGGDGGVNDSSSSSSLLGTLTQDEVSEAASFPTIAATAHSSPIPCVSSISSSQKQQRCPRFEATLAVTDLPKGRYFIVPFTRRGGQIGFDVILRCFSSNSAGNASVTTSGNSNSGDDAVPTTATPKSADRRCVRFTGAVRPLGDWARDQQLLDYKEETSLRRSVASGAVVMGGDSGGPSSAAVFTTFSTSPPNVMKMAFVGCNVKELLRGNKQFLDRDFPPMPSSLWMDAVNAYPRAPLLARDGKWLRASEIAKRQQERYLHSVVLPSEGEAGSGSSNSSSSSNKLALKDLEMVMMRRKPVLGSVNSISTGGGSSSDASSSSSSATNAGADGLAGMASFLASNAYATYSRRVLPAKYAGCSAEHTNLGSEVSYLSALACVLTRPTTFADRMVGGYNSDGGVAQFRFFINGKWTTVVVDDYLPVDDAGDLCFTTSIVEGDFLAPLVEKAYAKAHRCYAALSVDRGLVKKRVIGVLPPQEERGDEALLSSSASSSSLQPKPPAAGASASSTAMILADQGVTINNATAGANFRRTVLARSYGNASSSSSTAPPRLTDAMVLTTDSSTATVPTAPVLAYDQAPYGVDIEAAHDSAALQQQRAVMRSGGTIGGGGGGGRAAFESTRGAAKKSSSNGTDQPSSPIYVPSGTFNAIRYGEPPIVLLHQSLTDFTGAVVRVYDITTTIASGVVGGGVVSTTASGAVTIPKQRAVGGGATTTLIPHSPSHLGNNTTDSSAYFSSGMLPPHIYETISSSLYLCEDEVMNRRDLAWQKILECVFDPEKIIAGALMTGAQGWEQRKHCGLQFNALYPFIDAREVDGQRLVKVFNNWGSPNVVVEAKGKGADREGHHNTLWWKGKFAWGSGGGSTATPAAESSNGEGGGAAEGWTPRLKAAVGYDISHSKTCLWMSITEVVYYFSHLFEASYDANAVGGGGAGGGSAVTAAAPLESTLRDVTPTSSAPPSHAVWVEGGYGPQHVGGSFKSSSWVNNDQYALRIVDGVASASGGAGGAKAVHDNNDIIEVTVGIHQSNQKNKMTRTRDARYTYAGKPLGLCLVRTKDDSRRLATLTKDDVVTTLHPAAVRDRYHTFTIPRGVLSSSPSSSSSSSDKFILMPFVSVAGANDDEVRWANAHSMEDDEGNTVTNPFAPRHGTEYFISVSSRDAPCSVTKILDDTRTMIEGEWSGPTAGGPPTRGTWRNNPQFLIYPSLDGEVTITLRQRNNTDSTAAHIGFVVVDGSAAHLTRLLHLEGRVYNESADMLVIPNTTVLDVPHCNDHAVTGTVQLRGMQSRRGKPYHIVPSCSESGLDTGFSIEITSANAVKITEVPVERDWKSVNISESFKLSSGNTGGSVSFSTWRNNPQYLLKFPYEQTSRLLISITNKNASDGEKIGCVLFAGDKFSTTSSPSSVVATRPTQTVKGLRNGSNSNSDCRKLLLSNSASKPIYTKLVVDEAKAKQNAAKKKAKQQAISSGELVEGPNTNSLLGPSFEDYSLEDAATRLPLLEENRAAQRSIDALVDTGAYAHHSEVFYDLKLSSADEGVILMPYTNMPMTECDVEITVLSTAPIELHPVEEYTVTVAEGAWAPGVSAGGARAESNAWINNPFYSLNLIGSMVRMRPTRLFIVMLMYSKGPEKPLLKKVGKTKVVVPPTTATVPPLSTMLALTKCGGDNDNGAAAAAASSNFSAVALISGTSGSYKSAAGLALATAKVTDLTSSAAFAYSSMKATTATTARGGDSATAAFSTMRDRNGVVHNTHTSVASRTSFGFDVVRGDALNTPVFSSRHTCEGEASVLVEEGLLPCADTQLPYFIVPHTREQGVEGYFKLLVYSDQPIQLSAYEKPKRYW